MPQIQVHLVHPVREGLLANPRENKPRSGRGKVVQYYDVEHSRPARSMRGERKEAMRRIVEAASHSANRAVDVDGKILSVAENVTASNGDVVDFVNELRPLVSYKEKVNNESHPKDNCKYGQFYDKELKRWRCIKNLNHHSAEEQHERHSLYGSQIGSQHSIGTMRSFPSSRSNSQSIGSLSEFDY